MAKTISAKLDEEEKKIIDLIRQHKLDYNDVEWLFKLGAKANIEDISKILTDRNPILQQALDKYTKLLRHLEGG